MNKPKKNTLINAVIKDLRRRNFKSEISPSKLIAELIYFNVAAYQRSLIANHNKTEWDNKIDEVVKSNSREKRI